jgi:DNA-binding response OmpR family regulator
VVEDELLIAMDIIQALEDAGAAVTVTNTLGHAMLVVEEGGISGAIVDHALHDGLTTSLRQRLKEREIPFLIYSGMNNTSDTDVDGVVRIQKPATQEQLVTAMARVIMAASPLQ